MLTILSWFTTLTKLCVLTTLCCTISTTVDEYKVKIVDPFTGRIMDGRRYSDGLHQAIEAEENVEIEDESKTMATITFQNYFRMYEKAMTGTATLRKKNSRTAA